MEFPAHVLAALKTGKEYEVELPPVAEKVTIDDVTHKVLNRGAIIENEMTPVTERTMAYVDELEEQPVKRIRHANNPAAKHAAAKRKFDNWLGRDPYKYGRVIEILRKAYPAIFNGRCLLKVGIYKDIKAALDIPARDLSYTLNKYCGKTTYLEMIVLGAKRYDIIGQEVAIVGEKEVDIATTELVRRDKINAAREADCG
jgi:hypothetical protein